MQRTETSPDDVIDSLPEPARDEIRSLDETISRTMDGLPRDVWEGPFWGGTQQRIIGLIRLPPKASRGTPPGRAR